MSSSSRKRDHAAPEQDDEDEAVFKALASGTRRHMLDVLRAFQSI